MNNNSAKPNITGLMWCGVWVLGKVWVVVVLVPDKLTVESWVDCKGMPPVLVSSVLVVPGWTAEVWAPGYPVGAAEVCGLWVVVWEPVLVPVDKLLVLAMPLLYGTWRNS